MKRKALNRKILEQEADRVANWLIVMTAEEIGPCSAMTKASESILLRQVIMKTVYVCWSSGIDVNKVFASKVLQVGKVSERQVRARYKRFVNNWPREFLLRLIANCLRRIEIWMEKYPYAFELKENAGTDFEKVKSDLLALQWVCEREKCTG